MKKLTIGLMILLFFFSLNFIGISGFVESPGIISLDIIVWIILLLVCLANIFKIKYYEYITLGALSLWILQQYLDHWKYFILGIPKKYAISYNNFFEGMHRIFPASETRFVPDTYHIVLISLLLLNFVLVIKKIIK